MNVLLIVISFYLGMLMQYLIYMGVMRLRRQTVALHTPEGWRKVDLHPAEDIAEAELLWQQAIGAWRN